MPFAAGQGRWSALGQSIARITLESLFVVRRQTSSDLSPCHPARHTAVAVMLRTAIASVTGARTTNAGRIAPTRRRQVYVRDKTPDSSTELPGAERREESAGPQELTDTLLKEVRARTLQLRAEAQSEGR